MSKRDPFRTVKLAEVDGTEREYIALPLSEVGEDPKRGKLRERMARWFKRKKSADVGDDLDSLTTERTPEELGTSSAFDSRRSYYGLELDASRESAYKDYQRMDREEVYLRRALEITVGDVFHSRTGDKESYELSCEVDETLELIKACDKRLKLPQVAPQICYSGLKFGDDFEEIVWDTARMMRRLKWLNPAETTRNEDRFGRLDPNKAFTYKPSGGASAASGVQGGPGDATDYRWFEIAHFRHNVERGNPYGNSQYMTARRPFRILHPMEESIAIDFLVNAGDRLVYYIPCPKGATKEVKERIVNDAIMRYRRRMVLDQTTGRIDITKIPIAENVDIFIGTEADSNGRVERLPGSRSFTNLGPLEWFQNQEIASVGVPKAYLQLERDVNSKATLGWQDIQYARIVRGTQREMSDFQREIYDRQIIALRADEAVEPTDSEEAARTQRATIFGKFCVDSDALEEAASRFMPSGVTEAEPGKPKEEKKDPNYYITYPPVSSTDEEVRLSIQQMQWNIASAARASLGVPTEWLLREIVGLDEEQVGEIMASKDFSPPSPAQAALGLPGGSEGATRRDREASREAATKNAKLAAEVAKLRDALQIIVSEGFLKPAKFGPGGAVER